MAPSNENLKRDLAKLLWTEGFGDDPFRNWRMAELMIIDDGFLSWRRQALALREFEDRGGLEGEEGSQSLVDFLTGVAYWVHITSLGLDRPSRDPMVNWRVAQALRGWLCTLDY